MPMHTPPHPGGIVKDVITDLDLTVTDAAAVLNVSRPTLSSVINGRAGISPEMAVRLSKAFGSTTGFWLRLQMNYDLAEVERRAATIVVNPLPAAVATASPTEAGR